MSEAMKIDRTGDWNTRDILFSIARFPDSERLFIGSSDFHIYEFDVSQEKPERVEFTGEGHRSYVTGMALIGEQLVTGSYDGQLIWWNIAERTQVRAQPGHNRWIRQVIATPDQQRVISVADDMQCKVWDAKTGTLIKSFSDHAELTPHHYPSMLYAVAVTQDGTRFATGDRVGHVAIWDAETFEKVGEVSAPGVYTWDPRARRHSIGGIRSLAFSPDGTRIAVGGVGKIGNIDHLDGPSRLEIFRWETDQPSIVIEDDKKKGLIEGILWHSDGTRLLAFGGDHKGFVNLYDVKDIEKGELLAQQEGNGHLHAGVLNESQSILYTAGHNRVNRFEVKTEPVVATETE